MGGLWSAEEAQWSLYRAQNDPGGIRCVLDTTVEDQQECDGCR